METSNEIIQLVSFKIGEEEFGVEISRVREIIKLLEITSIPNSPPFVEGIINLRGSTVPVISLRKRLNMEERKADNQSRIIVIDFSGKTIGFIVDAVYEVLRIESNIIENPPEIACGINQNLINSICKLDDRLLILLDLERILNEEETHKLSEVI